MKVEFLDSNVLGPNLVIAYVDYIKARASTREFDSLVHALSGFAALWGLDIELSRGEYDRIDEALGKSGSVIFGVDADEGEEAVGLIAYIANGSQIEKFLELYADGKTRIFAKYDSSAIGRIVKRHETERRNGGKRHE